MRRRREILSDTTKVGMVLGFTIIGTAAPKIAHAPNCTCCATDTGQLTA